MKRYKPISFLVLPLMLIVAMAIVPSEKMAKPTHSPATPSVSPKASSTPTTVPALSPTPAPPVPGLPYPSAPLCATHSNDEFHTLWGSGCHYDHEHGQDPFTAEVDAAFPGFDLFALLGAVPSGRIGAYN